MMLPTRLLMPFAALSLGACALLPGRENPEWPAELPARTYFEAQYRGDPKNARIQSEENYLLWVRRFYLGSDLYPYGFRDIETLVLDDSMADNARLAGKLKRLGRSIAGDWAKHRSAKRLTTVMLSIWGSAIQAAVSAGRSEAVIDLVSADVRDLLSGRLPPAAIAAARYGGDREIALNEFCRSGAPEC